MQIADTFAHRAITKPNYDTCFSSGSAWLFFTPDLMKDVLVWIKDAYNNPPLYITENGWSDRTGQLNDTGRVNYYKYYINHVLQGDPLKYSL